VDYKDQLRLLTLNDTDFVDQLMAHSGSSAPQLDARTLACARLGALIATGGSEPSYGVEIDAALRAGATEPEIVGILTGIASVVGVPCVVSAAPDLALALGFDAELALEQQDDRC
jgi:4-carboxymuconolactone decarboxylase